MTINIVNRLEKIFIHSIIHLFIHTFISIADSDRNTLIFYS